MGVIDIRYIALNARYQVVHRAQKLILIATVFALAGCSSGQDVTPNDLNALYEQALADTAVPVASILAPGSRAEREMLDRLENYFASMDASKVNDKTAQVYHQQAYLYDNLTMIQGVESIQSYFAKAVAETDAINVDFLQIARDQEDYFIRWRMAITSSELNAGEPLVSYGVSQFRFDGQGKVLLHRDFWDAATGMYEYLPVLGGLVARARSILADH